MHLGAIHLYPIKSARGISLSSASLDDFGLARDRRWMVVDSSGRFVSQREAHQLALVEVGLDGDDLIVGTAGLPDLRVSPPPADGPEEYVTIWGDSCLAQDGGAKAADWFSTYLDRSVRLVFMPPTTFRVANPAYVPHPRRVSFADAYPLLLIGEESLADLNRRLETPLPMNRFRPNLVVVGSEAFAEDGWTTIRVGEVVLDVVKPCDRCVTTTIDQATAVAGKEPLRTLSQFRKWKGQVYFGQNVVHRTQGILRTGDPVIA